MKYLYNTSYKWVKYNYKIKQLYLTNLNNSIYCYKVLLK